MVTFELKTTNNSAPIKIQTGGRNNGKRLGIFVYWPGFSFVLGLARLETTNLNFIKMYFD